MSDEPRPPVEYNPVVRQVCRVLLREIHYAKNSEHTYILHANGLRYLRIRLPDGCTFQCDAEDGAWMDVHSAAGERLHGITIYQPTMPMVCAAARAICDDSIRTRNPVPLADHELAELREMEGWSDEPY
jgi:hypothetical protein